MQNYYFICKWNKTAHKSVTLRQCQCQWRQLGGSRVKLAMARVEGLFARAPGEGGGATSEAHQAPCGNKSTHSRLSSCRLRSQRRQTAQFSCGASARETRPTFPPHTNPPRDTFREYLFPFAYKRQSCFCFAQLFIVVGAEERFSGRVGRWLSGLFGREWVRPPACLICGARCLLAKTAGAINI